VARFRGWPRVMLDLPQKGRVEAAAPLILSASRATDLPAFHGPWFLERLRAGYLTWTNPFDGRPQAIALDRVRAVVFWTKDPGPFLALLPELEQRGLHFYFQYTVNDYEAEGLEPGLPPLETRLERFLALSGRLGPARVVWRFAPLILARGLDQSELLRRAARIADRLAGATERLVFSFADVDAYPRVRRALRAAGVPWRPFDEGGMRRLAAGLAAVGREHGLEVMACAEALDLSDLGVSRSRCVDGRLLARIAPGDRELAEFLDRFPGKDPGQRTACGCCPSKDIGAYGTCAHGCVYCYAGGRRGAAGPG